jgi:MATE family multidrug resistance protein
MYATLIANIINIVLNYLFIFGKFGAPELGVVGAAIGTLVSRIVMVVFLWILLKKNSKTKAYVSDLTLKVSKRMFKKIMSLGFPSAMQMFFEVAIFTAAIWLSGVLGKNPQAANQIALNLASMTFMIAMGLSVTAMIRVGNQKGLKNYQNLRRIAFSIFLLTLIIDAFFAGFFWALKDWLPGIYLDEHDIVNQIDNMEVMAIASKLLLVAAIFQISDGLQVVVLGALRGLQDVMIPTLLTFISYWIIGFPISYYLGLHTELASSGIWIGLLAGLTAASVFLYIRFNYLSKKLIRG